MRQLWKRRNHENSVNVSSDILCSFNNRDSRSGRGDSTGTHQSRAATDRKYTAAKCEHASPKR